MSNMISDPLTVCLKMRYTRVQPPNSLILARKIAISQQLSGTSRCFLMLFAMNFPTKSMGKRGRFGEGSSERRQRLRCSQANVMVGRLMIIKYPFNMINELYL